MLSDDPAAWFCKDATTSRNSRAPTREKEGIWVRCAGVLIGDGVPDDFGESCVWTVIFGRLGSDTTCARAGPGESSTVKVFEDEGLTTG